MEIWSNGKTVLDIEFNNVKRKKFLLRINPAREGILNIPIFHCSIYHAKSQSSINPLNSISCTNSETSIYYFFLLPMTDLRGPFLVLALVLVL